MNQYDFLLVMVVISLFLFYICIQKNIERKIIIFIGSIIVFGVMVFRPLDFPDTNAYKNIFEKIEISKRYGFSLLGHKEFSTGVEYGYLLLNQFIKKFISDNFRVFFALVILVEILFYNKYIKRLYGSDSKKKFEMFLFTLPYFGYMYLGVVVRTGLAMTVGLNAFLIGKFEKKQFTLKILFLKISLYIVAVAFHRTALLFLLIECIYYFVPVFSKKIYIILWGVSGLFLFMQTKVLTEILFLLFDMLSKISVTFGSYQHYFNNYLFITNNIRFRQVFFWIIGLLFFFVNDKSMQYYFKKNLNIYIIGIFLMSMLSFISGSSRVYDYFMLSVPVLLTEVNESRIIFHPKKLLLLFDFFYVVLSVFIILRL